MIWVLLKAYFFASMSEVPSLYTLCIKEIKKDILLCGDDISPDIYELPQDLFDSLLTCLPPIALQKLQENMPLKSSDESESIDDCPRSKRKCIRYLNFNAAWKELYIVRWPHLVSQNQKANWLAKQGLKACISTKDWQQMYWETHLQNCLDEVSEVALLPTFSGSIGEISIPDAILGFIGYLGHKNCSRCDCAKFSHHCQRFAFYARYLKLQNVLCVAESYNLLITSKLHQLEVHRINSEEHVQTLCKLLKQNQQTLTSLEFIRCKLSSAYLNEIFGSLSMDGQQAHIIKKFSIKASCFIEMDRRKLPIGLASFLLSGRSLTSLILCENHLKQDFGKMLFEMLSGAASSIPVLDDSENNIAGLSSHIDCRPSFCSQSSPVGNFFQSLCVLNLRGNDLRKGDAFSLKSTLVYMHNLEILDISDNPIEDAGIKNLLPYFVEMSERFPRLTDLRVENCELSCDGVDQLLDVLSIMKRPLASLSIGGNDLGSKSGAILSKFLHTGVEALDIEGIGLGSYGFLKLQEEMRDDLKLVYINMSKNRGGVEAAKFLAKLIQQASELVAVNAGYNFIPVDSFSIICSAMAIAKGKLKHVDLTGNTWKDQSAVASVLSRYRINEESVILPSSTAPYTPHDDDP